MAPRRTRRTHPRPRPRRARHRHLRTCFSACRYILIVLVSARTVRIVPGDVDDEAELRALQRSTDRKTLALLLGSAVVLFALAVSGLELWWHAHPKSSANDAGGTSVTLPATTTPDPKPAVEQT